MKLLLILLLVLAVVSVLALKTAPKMPSKATASGLNQRRPGHAWRASLLIGLLRAARAGVATTALMALVVASKFLLIFAASSHAEGGHWHALKLLVLLALIGLMLRFLYLLFGRLRLKVNQVHQARSPGAAPLLGSHWSL